MHAAAHDAAPVNEYEQQRLDRIKANMERMKELNLQFMASKIAAPPRAPAAQRRRAAPAEPTEARRSERARGISAPGYTDDAYDDDYSGDDADEEGAARARRARAGGRRAYIPQGPSAWDGQREFVLPPLLNEHGVEIQRNKSCHICTQCLASWRGNFTRPLACSACPRIFCSRCLFHINGAETVDEAEAFIAEHQGNGWLCFTCTGTCACQESGARGLTRIDAHKRRGWVGVTGGGLAPCDRRPRLSKRATRADVAVAALAEGMPSSEGTPSPDGASPASPTQPSLPALEVTTPVRDDDEPAATTPEAQLPPGFVAAPAKRKRPEAKKRAAPAAPGAEGEAIVGRRVEAYWTVYKVFYPGFLESFDAATGFHRIRYDDGEYEDVTLPDKTVRYEAASA